MQKSPLKLGKLTPRNDPRTLRMARYLDAAKLPKVPAARSWAGRVKSWPMMLNDAIGDCTIAAAGHLLELWTADMVRPTDAQVRSAYSAVSGYNAKTGANDNGAVELDVLNYWRKHGIGGRKIEAFASIDPRISAQVRAGVELFGGVYIGLGLPISAQQQIGKLWHVTSGKDSETGSWGGHAVPIVAYDHVGLTCVTWGTLQTMTWGFFQQYCDEAWGILSVDWLDDNHQSPDGFDLQQLLADLKAI